MKYKIYCGDKTVRGKYLHYCNRVVDPATCCVLGGHRSESIEESFDHPDCTCPEIWKIRYMEYLDKIQ